VQPAFALMIVWRFGVAGPGFALKIARASARLRREAASARSRRSAP